MGRRIFNQTWEALSKIIFISVWINNDYFLKLSWACLHLIYLSVPWSHEGQWDYLCSHVITAWGHWRISWVGMKLVQMAVLGGVGWGVCVCVCGGGGGGGGGVKNVYELLHLRALKISILYENCISWCMGKIFGVEFQRFILQFHAKYFTHTFKGVHFIHRWKLKSS